MSDITTKKIFDSKNTCLYESFPECYGTGLKKDGQKCIHMLSCKCRKCNEV